MKQRTDNSCGRGLLVLVDLDGVVADLERSFHERLSIDHPDIGIVPPEARRSYRLDHEYPRNVVEEILGREGFFRDLVPIDGALDGVASLIVAGHSVVICSAPYQRSSTCADEKRSWIRAHLGRTMAESCFIVPDKSQVPGDVLIDDFPRGVGRSLPAWRQVLFDQSYNRAVDAGPLDQLGVSTLPVRWNGWGEIDLLLDQLDRERDR